MFWKIKNWILDVTEPWREEREALRLEWEVFARKHNAAGKMPPFWYPGMELDPMEKVVLVDAHEVSPNYLRDQHAEAQANVRLRDEEREAKFNNRLDEEDE